MYNESVRLTSLEIPARFSRKDKLAQTGEDVPMHYHNEIELLCIYDGELPCVVNGESLVIKQGEILFINSRVPHSTRPYPAILDFIQINTEKLLFSKSSKSFLSTLILDRNISHYIFKEPEITYLMTLFNKTFQEYTFQRAGSSSFLLGILHMICGVLIRCELITNPDDVFKNRKLEKISPAINYILESYSKDITTPYLAHLCSLNTGYFCELFKSSTGKTPIEFLNTLRVYQAEKLINSTNKNMTEIALEVGFSTPNYFNSVFKKVNGNSPTYYRRLKFGNM